MNENIKLLAKQAGIIGQSEGSVAPPLEKFAELLIRECSSLAYDGPGGVLEHFGIDDGLTN